MGGERRWRREARVRPPRPEPMMAILGVGVVVVEDIVLMLGEVCGDSVSRKWMYL